MKISELNTNTYLNNDGAPENSYLLINYAAGQGMSASTQKVSLDTLGKAVAAKLNLPIAITDNSGNVTGLQHVAASGNQYHVENLNASFSGGDGGSSIGVSPVSASWGLGDLSEDPVEVKAYPVFYVPTAASAPSPELDYTSGEGIFVLLDETENGYNLIAMGKNGYDMKDGTPDKTSEG